MALTPPARGQVLPAGGETHLIIGRRNFSAAWLKDNHPAVSEKILSLWGAPPALVQSRVEAARKASVVARARDESSRRGEGGGQGQDEGQAQDIEAGTAGRLGSAGAAAGKAGSAPGRVPPHHKRAEVHAEQAVGGRAAAPPPPPPPHRKLDVVAPVSTCVVCLDAENSHTCVPCGHKCAPPTPPPCAGPGAPERRRAAASTRRAAPPQVRVREPGVRRQPQGAVPHLPQRVYRPHAHP